MALFMLTNSFLEVLLGATWWSLKKTYNGIYYVIYGDESTNNSIEIPPEDLEKNKELLNLLLQQTKDQQIEIKKLTENVCFLTDYMKTNTNLINNSDPTTNDNIENSISNNITNNS